MEGKKYLLALSQCDKLGPSRLLRLKAHFNSWQNAWEGKRDDLIQAGLPPDIAHELVSFRKSFDHELIEARLEKYKIKTIALEEREYPALLKHIYLPPPLLYYRGSLAALARHSLSVVGARKATAYGAQATEKIITESARAGLTIVSGLALGIDALAHEASLAAAGLTVAVLGAGLDTIYPNANVKLAHRIEESGCLLSEFKPGTPPFKGNFPRRNRLIAGLGLGTLVIEAAEKSGALISARYALQENREVMAVPGNIFSPASIGTNQLIKDGARPVTCAADVFAALRIEHLSTAPEARSVMIEPGEEEQIIACLNHEPAHINEIARLTKLDMSAINSRLTIMEMKGLVRNTGNLSYIRLF